MPPPLNSVSQCPSDVSRCFDALDADVLGESEKPIAGGSRSVLLSDRPIVLQPLDSNLCGPLVVEIVTCDALAVLLKLTEDDLPLMP